MRRSDAKGKTIRSVQRPQPELARLNNQTSLHPPPITTHAYDITVTVVRSAVFPASWASSRPRSRGKIQLDRAKSNRLILNPDKSEAIWCATSRRQHQLPTAAVPIVGVQITPAWSVHDLGIYIDADLSVRVHVELTVSRWCFAVIRRLRQIRRAIPTATFHMLVRGVARNFIWGGGGINFD